MNARFGKPVALVLAAAMLLSACSTIDTMRGRTSQGQRLDPWESWNRKVFAFNDGLDEHVLKPVATGYHDVVPQPVRTGVDHFFNNIGDAWSAVNLALQFRFKAALNQGMRFAVNSTFGIGGLLDIATEAGIERNPQDFGKTLGHWGFGTGAYIVWPLFGPSSVRDTIGLSLDRVASPVWLVDDGKAKVAIFTLETINTRANLLRATDMLEGIALDKYTFYRDAYLQRRGSFDDDDAGEVINGSEALPDATAPAPAAPAAASAPAGSAAPMPAASDAAPAVPQAASAPASAASS